MTRVTTRTVKLTGTAGPAKWAAVVALAMASGAGLTWGLTRRASVAPEPRRVETGAPTRESVVEVAPFMPARRAVGPETPRDEVEAEAVSAPAAERRATQEAAPESIQGITPATPEPEPAKVGPRKINLNTATAAELELLPGVGPAMAKRILDYRAANGKFRSITDLDKVRGIGPKTFEKIRPLVAVD